MRNLTQLTDNDLKEQLIQTYVYNGFNTDEVNNIKHELYRRGYNRHTIIHLAIKSQLRQGR